MTNLERQQPQETFSQAGRIASAMGIARGNNPYRHDQARASWDEGHHKAERDAEHTARTLQIQASKAGQLRKAPGRVTTFEWGKVKRLTGRWERISA